MTVVTELLRSYIEKHPIEIAQVIERFSTEEAWEQLKDSELEDQAEVLEFCTPEFAARLLREREADTRYELFREMDSDSLANLLPYFSKLEQDKIIQDLPALHAEEVVSLADYAEDTAGSIMSPDFTALREDASVSDAIRRLRRLALVGRSPSYIYVINDNEMLTGVLMMRDLVLSHPNERLKNIMIKNVISVEAEDDLADVAQLLSERNLLAVPVVDEAQNLVGVITGTQLVSELQEEGFEDVQKMFGAGSDEHATSPFPFAIRKRLPWLQVNLATAFLAAAVVGSFDALIAQITILAAFLPVVAGQSGNAGAQALAVMLRSLAMNEVDSKQPRAVLIKEGIVGCVNGFATGLTAGLIAWFFSKNMVFGLVITVAMTLNLIIAGLAGAGIPILMERLNQDPAQSSNIILTTITDVLGFATFLGLAFLARPFLGNLM